jgi:hypothetical protein
VKAKSKQRRLRKESEDDDEDRPLRRSNVRESKLSLDNNQRSKSHSMEENEHRKNAI